MDAFPIIHGLNSLLILFIDWNPITILISDSAPSIRVFYDGGSHSIPDSPLFYLGRARLIVINKIENRFERVDNEGSGFGYDFFLLFIL